MLFRSTRPRRLAAWALVLGLAATGVATVPGAPSQAGTVGDLQVTPRDGFYGGQALTFSGTLGQPGVRRIWVELNFNRPGDEWERIDDFSTTTAADGSFRFTFPAAT